MPLWGCWPTAAGASEAQSEEEAVTKYLLIYEGQMDDPMPELSQEENDAMMQAWGDWMGRVGPALADGGALTGDRTRIGGSGAPLPITGYNIVGADSLDAAKALCENHPFLAGAPLTSPSTSTS
jgi:hypothetical protein